jgi:hypothetical protein
VWNRVNPQHKAIISLPLGIILFFPVYFGGMAFFQISTSFQISTPLLTGIINVIISRYAMLPVYLLSLQMTPFGWALDIAVITTIFSCGLLDTVHLLKTSRKSI